MGFILIFASMITGQEQQDADLLILNLSELERICLDSYLFNSSNKIEAYKVCKGITKDIDFVTLNSRANQWVNNKTSKAYLTKNKRIVIDSETQSIEHNESGLLTKNDMINRMTALVDLTNEPKVKKDIIKTLYDMQGHNKAEVKTESETKRIYLPERCLNCDYKRFYTDNQ